MKIRNIFKVKNLLEKRGLIGLIGFVLFVGLIGTIGLIRQQSAQADWPPARRASGSESLMMAD